MAFIGNVLQILAANVVLNLAFAVLQWRVLWFAEVMAVANGPVVPLGSVATVWMMLRMKTARVQSASGGGSAVPGTTTSRGLSSIGTPKRTAHSAAQLEGEAEAGREAAPP
eukprot:TRINITY_DN1975_c0_g1_i1.p3 TRINITY_DN1975_c0_g1~~TRINITY_DN1975_c0_g1_i1.p3  ORF type:complete len:111 (-),score=29.30 TRINITY_DN1975_c0_g1_i1:180-512(-)